jgi:hypothetical protein
MHVSSLPLLDKKIDGRTASFACHHGHARNRSNVDSGLAIPRVKAAFAASQRQYVAPPEKCQTFLAGNPNHQAVVAAVRAETWKSVRVRLETPP